jgi:hypothetical protein
MMKYLEDKINREILPFLKGYKKSWEFRFIQEMELDDKQKVAQTGAIRMGSISAGLGAGMPARLAYKIANDEPLSKADLEELDEAKQNAMMQEMGGMMGDEGNPDILGDQEQGRYGQGSEMYQPVNVSDYGQGGENTEQRMGNKEEVEYRKAGDVFYDAGSKYEIISANENFAKARVYLKPGQAAPEGRTVRQGSRGRSYYLTTLKQQAVHHKKKKGGGGGSGGGGEEEEQEHSAPDAPVIEGAQKMVRVTGDGIGVVAGIVNGKLAVKSLKSKETTGFIRKVVACAGGDKPAEFLSCMRSVGEDMDLDVSG